MGFGLPLIEPEFDSTTPVLTGFTAGSILFVNSTGDGFAEDNTNLFYDDTNNRVGLGTTAPTHTLTLSSDRTGIVWYNTTDQTTNFERVIASWSSNVFTIGMTVGGTGTSRNLTVTTPATLTLSGNSSTMTFVSGGFSFDQNVFVRGVDNGRFEFRPRVTTGTTAGLLIDNQPSGSGFSASSGTQLFAQFSATINQSSTAAYTGLLVNMTETSIGSGAKRLLDLQRSSTSRFHVAGGLTTLTASTEHTVFNVNFAETYSWSTGALTTQRFARFQSPTIAFAGASTLTTAIVVDIGRAPIDGSNATLQEVVALSVGSDATYTTHDASFAYRSIRIPDHTVTLTGDTAITTAAAIAGIYVGTITYDNSAGTPEVPVAVVAAIYVEAAPVIPASSTGLSLWIDDGTSRFDGQIDARHSISGLSATASTIAAGAAAGSSPTVSISGTNIRGRVTLTVGGSPTTGTLVTVTFGGSLAGAGKIVQLTPADADTANEVADWFVNSQPTTTTWTIEARAALTTAVQFIWDYVVIM